MKMVTGWKMQVLSLKNILISVLFCFILLNVSHAATLKVDTITPKGSASDLTFTRSATGDFVFTDMGTGFLKVSSDVLTSAASFDLTADVTGILPIANGGTGTSSTTFVNAATNITGTLPIANGGTNSSTALNNNFVMISSGGAIVESSTISTTELGFINGLDQSLATTDSVTFNGVILTSDATFQSPATFESTATFESAATFAELASDASTAPSGYRKIFAKADGFYQIDDAGTVSELGSGGAGGAGGINYIDNNDIETDTTGYSTFDDASAYVDGTGGTASNLTLTRNTTTPLRETGDLKLVQGAADSRYEGFSYDFTIDKGMQGEMLTASFWYDASDANYVDDDIRIFIFDKDNSKIIRVNGEDLKGGKGVHYFQFQAAADADDYRVSFMVNQSNTNGYSIYFDQIAVSPTRLARGAIIGKITEFTPSIGNLSHTIQKAWYWRSGQFMNVHIEMTTDAAASGTITIGTTLDGNSVDTSQIALRQRLGSGRYLGTLTSYNISVMYDNAIVLKPNQEGALSNTIPVAESGVDSGERITVNFTVPIQGWEAEGTLSEDLGGGEVLVRAAGNSGSTISANNPIDFTEIEDSCGCWDGTTFTAPSTGVYDLDGSIYLSANLAGAYIADRSVNSDVSLTDYQQTANSIIKLKGKFKLEKGETFTIETPHGSSQLNNSSAWHRLLVRKAATGSQKFETATVAAFYKSNSGSSVTSGSYHVAEDLVKDTHNAYNTSTGIYTIPQSGWYHVTARVTANAATTNVFVLRASLSGVTTDIDTGIEDNAPITSSKASVIHYFTKGDTVGYLNVTGSTITATTDNSKNFFSIARIK